MVSVRLVVGKDLGACGSGLSDYKVCSRLVEEHVVSQAGMPGLDAVGATETCVADEEMPTSIIILGIVVCADVVLLDSAHY